MDDGMIEWMTDNGWNDRLMDRWNGWNDKTKDGWLER